MMNSRPVVVLALAALLVVAAGSLASATTRNVPGQYATIQAAINAAANGDVVVVAKGTYRENIDFKGKAITVRSSDPTSAAVVAATIIDGQKKGSVVSFKTAEKSTSVLKGLTITNGSGTTLKIVGGVFAGLTTNLGGGIDCNGSSPTISGNVITNNGVVGTATVYPIGGGIGCYNASPMISGNTISGNKVNGGSNGGFGGGIGCGTGSPKIVDNTISGNTADATNNAGGGGIWCSATAETISGNVVSSNKSSLRGGGIYLERETAAVTVSGNIISNNVAAKGGGVYSWSAWTVFSNDIVSGNSATAYSGGGFMLCEGAVATIVNCTIGGNSAKYGGGVSCNDDALVTLRNTIVAFNTSGCDGDMGNKSKLVVTYSDFWANPGGNYVNFADQTGKGGNVSKDPLFANRTAGDFHEKSKRGRWNGSAWVTDTVQSPCINAGNPASAFANEPAPNGGRINMGAYGNTAYASKSDFAAYVAETRVGYATIQAALNAATTGQNVVVQPGTWHERINFNGKAITVRSTAPTEPAVVAATVINGDAGGSVVTFNHSEKVTSVLTGLTITNGSGTAATLASHPARAGGGIYCNGSSPTISGNAITGNSVVGTATVVPIGGGIHCNNASPVISGNTISGNKVKVNSGSNSGFGGGIGCYTSSPKIISNTVSGNTVYATDQAGGGGLWCHTGSPKIVNNTVSGNTVDAADNGEGGGICCTETSETISGNVITGNQSSYLGGGLKCVRETAPVTISDNIISNNTAAKGGGVSSWDASLTFTNDIVSGNSASIFGGGFKFDGGAVVTILNCTISGNSSAKGGGFSFTDDTSLTLRDSIVAFSLTGGGLEWHPGGTSSPKVVLSYCDLYGNVGGDYGSLPDQTGKNGNLSNNPLFAGAAKGDFHEKSKGGRWNPTTKAWVIDTVHSPCIDTGGPTYAFSKEPTPNGGRINMGAYGNTAYASKAAPKVLAGGLLLTATANSAAGGVTQIAVNLTSAASVQVSVLNLAGREVVALPEQNLQQGLSTLLWNGSSSRGTKAPAGRYLVRVLARGEGGDRSQVLTSLSLGR
ncbi:MAG: right-handed parallel beta-helix repeat-containing protein [Armatimonadota bacterium]